MVHSNARLTLAVAVGVAVALTRPAQAQVPTLAIYENTNEGINAITLDGTPLAFANGGYGPFGIKIPDNTYKDTEGSETSDTLVFKTINNEVRLTTFSSTGGDMSPAETANNPERLVIYDKNQVALLNVDIASRAEVSPEGSSLALVAGGSLPLALFALRRRRSRARAT